MASRIGVTQKGNDRPNTAIPIEKDTTGSRSINRRIKRPMLNAILVDL